MLLSVMKLKLEKKTQWKWIKSIIVFIGFYYAYFLQYIPVYLFQIDMSKLSNNWNIIVELSCFSEICCFIILLLLYRKDLIEEFKIFRKDPLKNLDTGLSCWLSGLLIMGIANFILANFFHSGGANNEEAVQNLIQALPWLMGIDICIIAPFVEEIVFRKTPKDVIKNKKGYVFLSGLLFGLAHVMGQANNIIDWLYIIPYGAMGASFALAYSKTDTIYTSMTFHFIHNTLLFTLSTIL